ncbi:hypothetical protein GQ43DRAFT_443202 [Delitschia confertaspora ATCC 74209]|uniref:N-acetyltransferase domain-containing protein n=1 Tax=Delitschia confertaspora ATCC 74209 TaxID=1513339 RepID=A0A9P4JIC5_9PLEO|nr:hypothetical protein GQ43DRAFT_443202 [Delitschia confertaspora ATCC 74209]
MAGDGKLSREDVILSPVTADDAIAIAEGTYAAMKRQMDNYEPEELRPAHQVRLSRFAKRMTPAFAMPHTKWTKAALKSNPGLIIGYCGWTTPEFGKAFNLLRKDAATEFGWVEQQGWSQAEFDDMWAGTDVGRWQEHLILYDNLRKELLGSEGHWFLEPLWVLPEYQGRGVGGMLVKEVIEAIDSQDRAVPVCLEASKEGKPLYERLGFISVPENPSFMVRKGPPRLPAS